MDTVLTYCICGNLLQQQLNTNTVSELIKGFS